MSNPSETYAIVRHDFTSCPQALAHNKHQYGATTVSVYLSRTEANRALIEHAQGDVGGWHENSPKNFYDQFQAQGGSLYYDKAGCLHLEMPNHNYQGQGTNFWVEKREIGGSLGRPMGMKRKESEEVIHNEDGPSKRRK